MLTKLIAIVGYTDWGKSNTLYQLFKKTNFWPLKSPISIDGFSDFKFVVINASNEDKITEEYLSRLEDVLNGHTHKEKLIFVITISLIFNGSSRDVRPVFKYLNELPSSKTDYFILDRSWFAGQKLSVPDLQSMAECISSDSIHHFSDVIDESNIKFEERIRSIANKINELYPT